MRRGARNDPAALIERAVNVATFPGCPRSSSTATLTGWVAPVNGDQLSAQFLRLNRLVDADGEWRAGDVREERKDGVITLDYVKGGRRVVRMCRVPELGHAWSGGDDALPFHSSTGPSAGALLWEFFRYQRRLNPVSALEPLVLAGVSPGIVNSTVSRKLARSQGFPIIGVFH